MMRQKKLPAKDALSQAMDDLLHKKPFSKISVNELCEAAGISRSAFYANFEDKYQFFACCIDEKHEFLKQLRATLAPEDFLTGMLDYIQHEDRFFYYAFGANDDHELLEIAYQFFNQEFTEILNEKLKEGMNLPGPLEMVSAFYIGGLTNTVLRWIMSNYALPKEELAACQYALLKDII